MPHLNFVPFISLALAATEDARLALVTGGAVSGANGRYSSTAQFASTSEAVAFLCARRAAVRTALSYLFATSTPEGLATVVGWVLDNVTVGASPADAVRVLRRFATIPGAGTLSVCCRRLAVVAMARASARYEPQAYDDAVAMLAEVGGLLEVEVEVAGNTGHDAAFVAFSALHAAVISDLTTRGASLAPLVTVSRPRSLPATVLAQQLYQDPTREDDLIARAAAPHPLFMPTSFLAEAR